MVLKERATVDETEDALPDILPAPSQERALWIRILYVGAALGLFLVGIVFWLIPVVTGIPFYIAGLVLLGMASTWVREEINRYERKLPYRYRVKLRRALHRDPYQRKREPSNPPAAKEPEPSELSHRA